jgi:hypothetical protein
MSDPLEIICHDHFLAVLKQKKPSKLEGFSYHDFMITKLSLAKLLTFSADSHLFRVSTKEQTLPAPNPARIDMHET